MKKNAKRALFLCPSYYPFVGGGKYYQRIVEGLGQLGYKATVWTPQRNPKHKEYEVINEVVVRRFDAGNKFKVWRFFLRNFFELLSFDLVHGFDFVMILFWYLPFRILLFWKPVFVTFLGHEGLFPIPQKIILERKLVELITWGNICAGDYIGKWYGTTPDYVVYGGVDKPNQELPYPDEPSAVFIGRLEPDMGILEYLEAIKILKTEMGLSLKLDIYGVIRDPSFKNRIDNYIKEYDLPVRYLGVADSVESTLQKYKYAFSSSNLVKHEAMICKRLVFSIYSNPLKKDYLEMSPKAKEMNEISGTPEELAQKIVFHVEHPEEDEKMLQKAYVYAKNQTWKEAARKHHLLFNKRRFRTKWRELFRVVLSLAKRRILA